MMNKKMIKFRKDVWEKLSDNRVSTGSSSKDGSECLLQAIVKLF